LSSEAIVGLDFLEQHQCVINADQHTLHLQGKAVPLWGGVRKSRNNESITHANVIIPNNVQVPALSEVELMAPTSLKQTDSLPNNCVFLVKATDGCSPIVVANAIVMPRAEFSKKSNGTYSAS